ncbi:hypothetical protein [Chondromyces crocatus]|uniref:Uncharacterized protein n=1 Tax=Chondromyces crocatus TaxID=52 RepID=A0A0K1EHX3_CHOCO|nr:hypothetical protein [Chondromyces crocatus]AKT40282.1 uncharacterized protein CMC5_044350 [Chondromyces crocatus]
MMTANPLHDLRSSGPSVSKGHPGTTGSVAPDTRGDVHPAMLPGAVSPRPEPTRATEGVADADAVLREELHRLGRYEDAWGRLKIRLHPASYLKRQDASHFVLRKVADGIAGLLVCDLGFANISVPSVLAAGWGVPADEVWARALQNVRAEGRLDEVPGKEFGVPLDLLASSSHYAASHLLFLEDYMPGDAGYGALVGVPQRHLLVRHIIRDREVFQAIHLMSQVIDDWYVADAGPISRDLYWWRGGQITRLVLDRRTNGLVLGTSEPFAGEVLAKVLAGS